VRVILEKEKVNQMSKGTVTVLVIIGCLLLAVANVALWATLNVFNADRFGEHVAAGLQTEESTAALAGPIVDRLMAEYPEFPQLLRQPAEEAVAMVLQRPVFTTVFEETAAAANKAMTTSAEDVVGIDLAGEISNVGGTVIGVISAIDPDAGANAQTALDAALDNAEENGRLAVYESGKFPKLRQLSNLAPWVGLLALVAAILLLEEAYRRAVDQHEALKYISVGIMITAGLAFMLFFPVMQGVAQNNLASPVMSVVVDQVVSALVISYAVQTLLVFFIGLVLFFINRHQVHQAQQSVATAAA
jgi:hypothetical protein